MQGLIEDCHSGRSKQRIGYGTETNRLGYSPFRVCFTASCWRSAAQPEVANRLAFRPTISRKLREQFRQRAELLRLFLQTGSAIERVARRTDGVQQRAIQCIDERVGRIADGRSSV